MRQYVAMLVTATVSGGCSIIYNTGNIPQAMQDATVVDAPFDADPSMLVVDDLAPSTIFEGQGDGGSRPAILVIHGANFVVGAQVSFATTPAIQLVPDNANIRIPASSDYLAVPVTAMVDTAPGHDSSLVVAVTVQVTQPVPGGGTVMKTLDGKLTWQGLDELDASPSTDASALKDKYSRVNLMNPSALAFVGGASNKPVLIRAISSIKIGAITAKGGNANGTTAGGAGPGACAGGGPGADAPCDGGGHKGNTPGALGGVGAEGGGAGFATMGMSGQAGTGPGAGGLPTGDDLISIYTSTAGKSNRASGGGGGGANGLSLGTGGSGGGGGGTVELTAGGDVMVSTIDVTGGAGSSASGGAAGGGGAGGVIMVRAGGTLVTGMLTASGGAGAATAGHGSDGRIRWDAASGSAPMATPAAVRGPAFVSETPLVLIDNTMVTLIGTPAHQINVYAIDALGHNLAGPQGVAFGSGDSKATFSAPLARGYNHLCVTLTAGVQGMPEADKCVDVAYLP